MSNEWYDIGTLQWVDSVNEWGFSTTTPSGVVGELYQIWTDDTYVYAATSSGLDIISVETEERYAFATYEDGYTTVWANDTTVYLGTSILGVKRLNKSAISAGEIASKIRVNPSTDGLLSNNVTYIHGNINGMAIGTTAGIHFLNFETSYMSHGPAVNVTKCFMPENYNYVYYIVEGTSVHRHYDTVGNWTSPDKTYTVGTHPLSNVTEINDIFVTAHTSLVTAGAANTLFFATDAGIFVLDEGTRECINYTTG